MQPVKAYAPGSEVLVDVTSSTPFKAQIQDVLVKHGGKVEYRVVWFDGRTRNSAWMESFEVEPIDCDMDTVTVEFSEVKE